ncbi:hypothetical protein EMPG_13077, partial [Blastomyces silverae]
MWIIGMRRIRLRSGPSPQTQNGKPQHNPTCPSTTTPNPPPSTSTSKASATSNQTPSSNKASPSSNASLQRSSPP